MKQFSTSFNRVLKRFSPASSLIWLLTAVLLLPSSLVQAQAPAWSGATSGNSDQLNGSTNATATATDALGNVYVTGYFYGWVAFGNIRLTSTRLPNANGVDLFVAKYVPSTGTWAWAQRGGGTGSDQGFGIAVNGTSVYVTGHITNDTNNSQSVTFGGVDAATSLVQQNGATSTSSTDVVVAKYTDNGTTATLNWVQVGGGTDADQGNGIAVNGSNVYVTGAIYNNTTNANQVVFGGSGTVAGTTLQRGASGTASKDVLVAKYTDNGNTASLGWTQVGGGTGVDQGNGIAVNGPSIYITGSFSDVGCSAGVVFGGSGSTAGTVVQCGNAGAYASDAILVAKYTDNGSTATVNWTQAGGGGASDIGYGIAVSGTSVYVTGIIATGLYTAPVVFGGSGTTGGTFYQNGAIYNNGSSNNSSGQDIVLVKYTDNGNSATVGWVQVAGGYGADYGYGVAVSGTSVYVTGVLTNNTANLNLVVFGGSGMTAGTNQQFGVSSVISSDVVVAKYTDNGPNATFNWSQVGGGTGSEYGRSIAVSGANLYVLGGIGGGTPAVFGTAAGSPVLGSSCSLLGQLVAATGSWQAVAVTSTGGNGITRATAVDGTGNVFVTGYFSGQLDFGTTTISSINNDIFVAKYVPSTGTWAWAQRGGGTGVDAGYGIAVSGNRVYISGFITNNNADDEAVTFGGTNVLNSPATQLGATGSNSQDIVVAKYTDNGTSATFNWSQVGGGTSNNEVGRGVAVSGASVYVIGSVLNNRANLYQVAFGGGGTTAASVQQNGTSIGIGEDLVVAKYVDNGSTANLGWVQIAGGNQSDIGYGITASGTNVYVVGSVQNNTANVNDVVFGGTGTTAGTIAQYGATNTSSPDILVAKYTDNGATATLKWTQIGGSYSYDEGTGIAVNGSNIYVTGYISSYRASNSAAVFGGTGSTVGTSQQLGTSSTGYNKDIVVAKYTDNGNTASFNWSQVGGDNQDDMGTSIAVSGTNVYVTGYIYANAPYALGATFGGAGTVLGTMTQSGMSSNSINDVVVAKYTDNGATAVFNWSQVGGGTGPDIGYGVAVSGQRVYIGGMSSSSDGVFGNFTVPNSTLLAQILDPTLPSLPLATGTPFPVRKLTLYPNPATPGSSISLTGVGAGEQVQILNILGQVVATAITNSIGQVVVPNRLLVGVYMVRWGDQVLRFAVE